MVIVTNDYADDFENFCNLNPKPCPIIEKLDSGSYTPYKSAPSADIRTDIVSYKKFKEGKLKDDDGYYNLRVMKQIENLY